MENNDLIERTYQALVSMVHTTAVSRKVVARPPFTFLHKMLVETLGNYDLFSEQQLVLSATTTKQAKAAFLTRAIAFVTFAMKANARRHHIPCLLLLTEVLQMPDRGVKDAAAKEVREKGDAYLYSLGVTFRKGLVLFQMIIRKRLHRVHNATLVDKSTEYGNEQAIFASIPNGRRNNSSFRNVQGNVRVVGYEEDAQAKDKFDNSKTEQIEICDTTHSRLDKPEHVETSISPNSLIQFQRHMTPKVESSVFLFSKSSLSASSSNIKTSESLDELQSNLEENQIDSSKLKDSSDWQRMLKKVLADGSSKPEMSYFDSDGHSRSQIEAMQMNTSDPSKASFPKLCNQHTRPLAPVKKRRSSNEGNSNTDTKSRHQKDGTPWQAAQVKLSNNTLTAESRLSRQRDTSSSNFQRSGTLLTNIQGADSPSLSLASLRDSVTTVYSGMYQTTDQCTQEQLTLVRDVVLRIDSYIKRKRLRVIDLFRYCDADGNGSISAEELIDTLSQMDIQLSSKQANVFLQHIDKDKNGLIDVDEFEMLVRIFRRNEAQREQVKRELKASKRRSEKSFGLKPSLVMKAKTKAAILNEFKIAQGGNDGMNAEQLRLLINRLSIPKMNAAFIDSLIDRAVGHAIGGLVALLSTSPEEQTRTQTDKHMISHQHLATALDELEWIEKPNRFLNQSWIRQFDFQLKRAIREYESI
ncbi:Calmodulin and related proteins (EF-Hand superfamily) [Plasmopara halstedii]|uniref:Calmodulin and related proteins (EF-Hand superfamily) n=1 Tax=Plasmopara halstedii TaxID=4781 RepID=A0A0P1AA36_PLAHL|nr:Calmodulin and related proteins (EF-Hand superfamily) [Plasmopara halstedii]CEG37114.1 Calmodulin and related proteins (EF-Hand superfamily) [Plasmopara halstedii]|eukprot:XP_024573483.1 Calmodulin and related proteins (EF-Hand superfamily) [Plasmopara halstedii]